MKIPLRPFDAGEFSAYGESLALPSDPGNQSYWNDVLTNARGDAALPRLDLLLRAPCTLPLALPKMEQHPKASQSFVPIDGAAYIVACADDNGSGAPKPRTLKAWLVPGDVAVTYRAGVWHAPLAVPDKAGRFAVFMFSTGRPGAPGPEDEIWVDLPGEVTLVAI